MGKMKKPDEILIIIGAMKSGTTSLFNYLAQHPQIAPSRLKEPGFYAADELWLKGFDWYFDIWDFKPDQHKLAMEATTDYTKFPLFPETAKRIKSTDDVKFKFIYIMRNPLRRIESHALHVSRVKMESCFIGPTSHDYSFDNGIEQNSIEFSKYAQQLDQFTKYFDKEDIFLTTLEELNSDPEKTMNNITGFLGISSYKFEDLSKSYNSYKSKTPPNKMHKFFSSINWLRAFYHFLLNENLRIKLYKKFGTTDGIDKNSRFKLYPDEEKNVIEKLKPDLVKLKEKYGIDAQQVWGIDLSDHKPG